MNLYMSKYWTGLSGMLMLLILQQAVYASPATYGHYKIDPGHTTVLFTVSYLGFSEMTGRFNSVEGNLFLDSGGASKVDVTIQSASVDTNHKRRDKHLRSPDFFNARQFPTIHFVSSKVMLDSKGELKSVQGDLTLRGKTRSVELAITPIGAGKDPWGGYRAGFNATTVVKRSHYGMGFMPEGIGDDIKITFNIEALKQ